MCNENSIFTTAERNNPNSFNTRPGCVNSGIAGIVNFGLAWLINYIVLYCGAVIIALAVHIIQTSITTKPWWRESFTFLTMQFTTIPTCGSSPYQLQVETYKLVSNV